MRARRVPIDERPETVNFALAAWVGLMAGVIISLGGFDARDLQSNAWVRLTTLGVTAGLLVMAFYTPSKWIARRLQLGVAVSLVMHTVGAIALAGLSLVTVADPHAEIDQLARPDTTTRPTQKTTFSPRPEAPDRPTFEQPVESLTPADEQPTPQASPDRPAITTAAPEPTAQQPAPAEQPLATPEPKRVEPIIAGSASDRPRRALPKPKFVLPAAPALEPDAPEPTNTPALVARTPSLPRVRDTAASPSPVKPAVAPAAPSVPDVATQTPANATPPTIELAPATRRATRSRPSRPPLVSVAPLALKLPEPTISSRPAPDMPVIPTTPTVSELPRDRRIASSPPPLPLNSLPLNPLPSAPSLASVPTPSASPPADLQAGPGAPGTPPSTLAPLAPRVARVARPLRPTPRVAPPTGLSLSPLPIKRKPAPAFADRHWRQTAPAAPPAGGPPPRTEEAIELGVRFLINTQRADGRWSFADAMAEERRASAAKADGAATGLALLALLGAGCDHYDTRHGERVRRALDFLIERQRADGLLMPELGRREDGDPSIGAEVWQVARYYSHGIAAIALCEAYGMTGDPTLREPAQRALDYLQQTQSESRGGWRYTPAVNADLSVTGWQLMALRSGELAGLAVRPEAYENVRQFVESCRERSGLQVRFRYNPLANPNDARTSHGRLPGTVMTAVGLLSAMYLGDDPRSARIQLGANHLLENLPTDRPDGDGRRVARISTIGNPLRDTYYWYYATQVMFHLGGDYWRHWNDVLHPLLIDSQATDGPLAGSWDPSSPLPDRWSHFGGRHYVTTMNLLSLEVYYRHLPLYDRVGEQP